MLMYMSDAPDLITCNYGVLEMHKKEHTFVSVRSQSGCLASKPETYNSICLRRQACIDLN
jgi:hypothetical protein